MRRNFFWAAVASIGISLGINGHVSAQQTMPSGDWLKQSTPILPRTPGYTTPGIANSMDGVGTNVRSDWVQDYYQGTGMFANSNTNNRPRYSVQTNGPTTTYTWSWGGRNQSNGANNGGIVGYSGMAPVTPTLLNPSLTAGYYPGAQIVRLRTPNSYAPYQYTVMPSNTMPNATRR